MANQFTSEWNDEIIQRMLELAKLHKLPKVTKILNKEFGTSFTYSGVRTKYIRVKDNWEPSVDPVQETQYKESIEILSDGSQKSDKLIELSEQELKDPEYVMTMHGYDPSEWEIVNARSSLWHYRDKDSEHAKPMYASKITVKPKKTGYDIKDLLNLVADLEPIHIDVEPLHNINDKLLEIPLFDQHFGISDYEYYKTTQQRIHNLITSREWSEIVFVVGQDMLHHNDHRNRTASGREIEQVDISQAWEDAKTFYEPLIYRAIKQAKQVKVIYNKGNHDESLSWAFVQMLKAQYPQVLFDDRFIERKIHTFGNVFLGFTHGDKGRKDLHNIFPVEFPQEWANAKVREVHIGHLHKEDAKDTYGMMVRTLATRNKTDKWHEDNGYIGNHKRFMLFEYSREELESIHYV